MPLESCMILLDNSEYMRNGDYIPTRLEAQHDAANLLVNQKTQSNPESTVGVIAMSGVGGGGGGGGFSSSSKSSSSSSSSSSAELLVSPTDDMGKILSALHGIPIRGQGASSDSGLDVPAAVQVASLALKHRRNKNGAQRVVLFVGSPLSNVESRALVRAGKQLKKNNVYIDVVALGELEENEPKLKELVDAANGSSGGGGDDGDGEGERTCHLVTIPAGVLPSDVLVSSPIVHGGVAGAGGGAAAAGAGGGGGSGAGGGGGGGGADGGFDEFGVDPNMDPELAMALRVSMEEERARQERAAAEDARRSAEENSSSGEEKEGEGTAAASAEGAMDVDEADSSKPSAEAKDDKKTAEVTATVDTAELEMGDEDALLQQALAMSMAESHAPPSSTDNNDSSSSKEETSKPAAAAASDEAMDMDEDDGGDAEAMRMALQMSMQPGEEAKASEESKKDDKKEESKQQFQDPQFVNQLLGSLPGVDPNDPAIRDALKNLNPTDDKKDGDDKKKEGGDKKDDSK